MDSCDDNKGLNHIAYTPGTPTFALMPEGRIMRTGAGWHWEYHLRDHLGNTRLTIADTAGRGVAVELQNTHYYPFGMSIATLSHTTAGHANPWLYNGKEHQPDFDLGWYDYGARFYDAEVGRFTGVDPIASDYVYVSPYNYAENSPVANIDLWGLQKFYAADGTLIKVGNPKIDKAYVTTNETRTIDFGYAGKIDFTVSVTKQLPITDTELNQRSIWVYNECKGSSEIIDNIVNNVGVAGNEAQGMQVADVYANAIQNAVETDGDWQKTLSGPRISRGEGNSGIAMMKGEGGNDYTKDLAKDYIKNGPSAFSNHDGATNARSAVINSVTNHKEIGGVRGWVGGNNAREYYNQTRTSNAKTVERFSFQSGNGKFSHSFYKDKP